MMKIDGTFGNVQQAAIDLLVKNGAVIKYDGQHGEFEKLPPGCQMGDFHNADSGLSGTRIHRNIIFNENEVDMGVSDGRKGQKCEYLKIRRVAPDLSDMQVILEA